jgi:hypothetical protein
MDFLPLFACVHAEEYWSSAQSAFDRSLQPVVLMMTKLPLFLLNKAIDLHVVDLHACPTVGVNYCGL